MAMSVGPTKKVENQSKEKPMIELKSVFWNGFLLMTYVLGTRIVMRKHK